MVLINDLVSTCSVPVLQVYLSPLLKKDFKELDGHRKRQLLKDSSSSSSSSAGGQTNGVAAPRPIDVLPCHNLTSTRIVEQLTSCQDLARMLADYRAKGGRIRQRDTPTAVAADIFSSAPASASASTSTSTTAAFNGQGRAGEGKGPVKADSEEEKPSKQNDMSWAPKVRESLYTVR